jgi:hypothetical protein
MNENIKKYCQLAVKCGLSREQTLKLVEVAFTDAAKAPEEVNVKFVKENLESIQKFVGSLKPEIFGKEYIFTTRLLENKSPFELVVAIPIKKSEKVIKLSEALFERIKKDDFYCLITYIDKLDEVVLYINNLNILNEHNRKVVLNTLESVGAVNICNQLKWARTIS